MQTDFEKRMTRLLESGGATLPGQQISREFCTCVKCIRERHVLSVPHYPRQDFAPSRTGDL